MKSDDVSVTAALRSNMLAHEQAQALPSAHLLHGLKDVIGPLPRLIEA